MRSHVTTTLRALAALAISSAVTAAAVGGTYLTTAPEPVSLALEPLSLLLVPGIFVGMIIANVLGYLRHHHNSKTSHDFTPEVVVIGAFLFYFLFFFYVLRWWSRRRAARTLTSTP